MAQIVPSHGTSSKLSAIFWDRAMQSVAELCLLPASHWFLAWLILQPWRWRQHVPPIHQLTFTMTVTMELSPCRDATSCAATQQLSSVLWYRMVHYSVYKSPPLEPYQSSPYHPVLSHLNILLVSFLLAFPPITYMYYLSLPYVLHTLTIIIITGRRVQCLWNSSMCSFLQTTRRYIPKHRTLRIWSKKKVKQSYPRNRA
jgi:hypothetical protein